MRTRPVVLFHCWWVMAGLSAAPNHAAAQITQPAPEAEDPELQERCADAVAVVVAGEPDSLLAESQRVVYACELSGGPAVARIWEDISGADADALNTLIAGSLHVRDARVLNAIIAAVADGTRTEAVGLAGLQVLVSYFDSRFWVSRDDLESPESRLFISGVHHVPTLPAGMPLPPDVQARVLDVFRDVSSQGPTPQTREAALFLRQAFARIAPDLTPVDPGAFSFEPICGSRVSVTNASDIKLPVTIQVVETGWTQGLTLPVGAVDIDYLPDRTGTLQLLHGGEARESRTPNEPHAGTLSCPRDRPAQLPVKLSPRGEGFDPPKAVTVRRPHRTPPPMDVTTRQGGVVCGLLTPHFLLLTAVACPRRESNSHAVAGTGF